MTKIMTTMTIDEDVYKKFQTLYPQQASSFCEEAMRKRIAFDSTNLEGVSQELLALEETKLQKALDDLNAKMGVIKETKSKIAQNIQESEIKKLQEEKERIESMGKCEACGSQISDETRKIMMGDKQFCKECFFNEHPAFIKAQKEERGKKDDSSL